MFIFSCIFGYLQTNRCLTDSTSRSSYP